MANSISVLSTVSQAKTFLIEEPKAYLLQDIFFPTADEDLFVSKEVAFDLDHGNFDIAPCVSKGYKNKNVVTWTATAVEPPRCGVEATVDPTDRDRQLFESLCYQMGEGNRAIAFQDYKRIVASRAADQIKRKIEVLCANVLLNNSIVGTMDNSPTDSTQVPIEIKYYDDAEGNAQRYLPANAWGQSGATPYDDICAMVDGLAVHGGEPKVLLMSPEAYACLANDEKYQEFFKSYHVLNSNLTGEDWAGGRKVAECVFSGYPLEIIVYSGSYKDDNGQMIRFLSKGFVCILDKNVGHTLCGGAVLINPSAVATDDLEFETFNQRRGKIIGSQFLDLNTQKANIRMESRPLPAPYKRWSWVTMDAQNSNNISGGTIGAVISVEFDSAVEGATLPADLTNQLGGSKVSIADATKSGETFDGWYLNGVKLVKDSDNKYTLPFVDCILEARFA
jgi:hypothetical protein